jgi:hypothetical protein
MATLKLDVPVLAQEKSMCCWHTSANMIWLYSQGKSGRQGPMNTIMPRYDDNTGLTVSAQAFIVLAQKVGLKPLPTKNLHSENDLVGYLKKYGPLWSAGFWYGFGHVIVLTGIAGGTVHVNDPDGGKKKTGTVAWFNEKLLSAVAGSLMYKDPDAY